MATVRSWLTGSRTEGSLRMPVWPALMIFVLRSCMLMVEQEPTCTQPQIEAGVDSIEALGGLAGGGEAPLKLY